MAWAATTQPAVRRFPAQRSSLKIAAVGVSKSRRSIGASPGGTQAMQALHKIALSKTVKSLATLLLVGLVGGGVASAQAQRTGGPAPSGPGAEVYFIDLKDGATVPAKLKLYFGLRSMGIAPAGTFRENSGHHHLLIDTELPPL